MRSVCLIYIPNSNYLLGTFDADFKHWWMATGFADVEKITKGTHIYGEISLTICKKLNGTWSIYQSKDNCISWHEVYNTTFKIFDIVLIMPGWAIMNTGNGFFKSDNAGTDWIQISELPNPDAPLAALANVGSDDILFCTDGRKVWKSIDYAETWVLSIDQAYFGRCNEEFGSATYPFIIPSPQLYPCIAGGNGIVIASYGPFITYSYDQGASWVRNQELGGIVTGKYLNYWDNNWTNPSIANHLRAEHDVEVSEPPYLSGVIPTFPPISLVFNRLPVNESSTIPQFVIKQLLVAYVDGLDPWNMRFLLRYDDRYPSNAAVAEPGLYSRLFYGQLKDSFAQELTWTYLFSQRLVNDSNDITSYEYAVTGENYISRILFSAQTRIDSNGVVSPNLMFSTDGGIIWNYADLSEMTIGPITGEYDNPLQTIIDDSYPTVTHVTPFCNNAVAWNRLPGKRTQLQSYDMDIYWIQPVIKTITYNFGGYLAGPNFIRYTASARLENDHTVEQEFASDIIAIHSKKLDMAVYVSGTETIYYWMHRYLEGYSRSTYEMGAIISESTFPEIVLPQAFNVQFPSCAEIGYPYDSRES